MGGPGSGRVSPDGIGRIRQQKVARLVTGSGTPTPDVALPSAVQAAFDRLAALTEGATFAQDSILIEQAARTLVRVRDLSARLDADPTNEATARLALATHRALTAALDRLGLTPKARATLVVPQDDSDDDDPLERLMQEYTP